MFSVRQILRPFQYARPLTTMNKLVNLTVDDECIAIVTMQRAPVNALNLELLQDLREALEEVEKRQYKGMVLTSALSTVFSGGMDITEARKLDLKRLDAYWTTFQDVWLKLFGSAFVTAAAINGHAPAGGCFLAMSCEYRVMADGKFTIGLNETAIGLTFPQMFVDTLCNILPRRQAELMLTTGKLFVPEEALKIGLIDEISTDKYDAIEKCKGFIRTFDNVSSAARSHTKLILRQGPLKSLQETRQADKESFLKSTMSPELQNQFEKILKTFKKNAQNM